MKALAKKLLLCVSTLSVFILSGCSTPKPTGPTIVTLQNQFNAEAAKYQMRAGNNTIMGSAFLRLTNGEVKKGAGCEVSLIAVTDYSTERIASIYYGNTGRGYRMIEARGVNFDNNPQEYFSTMKGTITDAYGAFKFTNLADGEYYVTTTITWSVYDPNHRNENGDYQSNYTTGGMLMLRVAVSGGEICEVVMTQ